MIYRKMCENNAIMPTTRFLRIIV